MDKSRVFVRLGGSVGGSGLPITKELHIVFVDVPQNASPPQLDAQFVNLHLPSVPLPSLTSPTFLTSNTPTASPNSPAPKKRKRPHPLVGLQSAPLSPGSNTVVILDKTLYLAVDRPTFHALGIPAARAKVRNAERRLLPLPLPLKPDARAVRALAPPRVDPVEMVLSCGATPPTPPEAAAGAAAAQLRGIEPKETCAFVPSELVVQAGAMLQAEVLGDDFDVADGLDAAQRLLTGIGAGGEEIKDSEKVAVVRRRYVGVCNGDMWESAVRCAVDALESGRSKMVVLGALGLWSARVNEDSEGFGGDSGVVAVLQMPIGKSVTYELRPRSEM